MFKKGIQITLILLILSIPTSNPVAQDSPYPIVISPPNITQVNITTTPQGTKIEIEDFTSIASSGDPNLPVKEITVLLPADASDYLTVELIDDIQEILEETHLIAPAPPLTTQIDDKKIVAWGDNKTIIDGKNVSIYETNAFFPPTHVELLEISQMRKWKLARIAYYPYLYNPVTKELLATKGGKIVLNEKLLAIKTINPGDPLMDPLSEQKLPSYVVNFEKSADWYTSTSTDDSISLEGGGAEFLLSSTEMLPTDTPSTLPGYYIFTTDAIRSTEVLNNFISHKASKGFNVQVITESAWDYSVGDEAANRIREYLKERYVPEQIIYVLFIGNPSPTISAVPMKMLRPRSGAATFPEYDIETPSDYFYADLTGEWDLDGDGIYGEFIDDFGPGGVDRYPEVFVGRIPFYENIDDLRSILQKIINYENGLMDGYWTRKVLLSMGPLDTSTPPRTYSYLLGEAIMDDIVNPSNDFYPFRIYESDYGLEPPPNYTDCSYTNVLNAWLQYAGLHVWWSQGSYLWATEVFSNTLASRLNNNYPSFIFAAAPENGHPEFSTNLAYVLLRNGAIATNSASRFCWYQEGETQFNTGTSPGMAYRYTGKLIRDFIPTGDALYEVKYESPLSSDFIWMNQCVFNLYGDPALAYSEASPIVRVEILHPEDYAIGGFNLNLSYRLNQGGTVSFYDGTRLISQSLQTRGEHIFTFENLSEGDHVLRVELLTEFGTGTSSIHYTASPPIEAPLKGVILEDNSGELLPLSDVLVTVMQDNMVVAEVLTDHLGQYETPPLLTGEYTVIPSLLFYQFIPEFIQVQIGYISPEPVNFVAQMTELTEESIEWREMVGVRDIEHATYNRLLQKTTANGWTSGAASKLAIRRAGGVIFKALETTRARMCGLSTSNPNVDFRTIGYAIYLRADATVAIFESGTAVSIPTRRYAAGDEFRVMRDGGQIIYTHNGEVIRSRADNTGGAPLIVDTSFYTQYATVADGRIVGGANAAPVAENLNVIIGKNSPVTITLKATDVNGDSLTYHIVSQPGSGTLGAVSGNQVTYTPAADYIGNTSFTYRAFDGTIYSNTVTVSIIVLDNGDPIGWTAMVGVRDIEHATYNKLLQKMTANGWTSGAASRLAIPAAGGVVFKALETTRARMCGLSTSNPNVDFRTIGYAIYLRADATVALFENGTAVSIPTRRYAAGDEFRVTRSGGQIIYTHNGEVIHSRADNTGGAPLIVDTSFYTQYATVADGRIVGGANAAPVAESFSVSTGKNSAVTITLKATDANGDSLTYHIVSQPGSGTLGTVSGNQVTYTPGADYIGNTSFTYRAYDGSVYSNTATVSISVLDNGDPIEWTAMVGVRDIEHATYNKLLQKTTANGWTSGAASRLAIPAAGGVVFKALETTRARMCGLSTSNPNVDYKTIGYAIYLRADATVAIFESGTAVSIPARKYAAGDEFRVTRNGGQIVYTHNGEVIHSRADNTGGAPLIVDTSFYTQYATVADGRIINLIE